MFPQMITRSDQAMGNSLRVGEANHIGSERAGAKRFAQDCSIDEILERSSETFCRKVHFGESVPETRCEVLRWSEDL